MRRERLLNCLEQRGLKAALLAGPKNFAWYTNGADNRVDHAGPGVAAVLVSPDGEWVVTDNIEARRMREEQTTDMEVVEHPWYEGPEGAVRQLAYGASLGSDTPFGDAEIIADAISVLRYVLDPDAAVRYREVGSDTVAALAEAEGVLSPEMSEAEAAAVFTAALRRRNLNSPVMLCASAKRAAHYRHPVHAIPLRARLGDWAMLVTCAERGGLYANATRFVEFAELDAGTQRLRDACTRILVGAREATRPGKTLAQVFSDIQALYAEEGFPKGWQEHHQGSITGYASREVMATPWTELEIKESMAFAWNPSLSRDGEIPIIGKAEETFLLTGNAQEVIAG